SGGGRDSDHRDADSVSPRVLLQILNVVDRHAATRLLPDLVPDVVEKRRDFKSFLAKPGIVGERQTKITGSDDGHAQLAIKAEDLPQMSPKIANVIPDAADAKLPEIGEVFADLGGVQVKTFSQALGRNGFHPRALELIEAAEVD